MGLFYIDTTYEESPEGQLKRREYYKECANEAIEYAKLLPSENCPDFLWDPQVNEFDEEDYRIRGSWDNPKVAEAYRIRRKYGDYWDYIDALEIYESYVEYVDFNYFSFKSAERAQLEGGGFIYIPKKPRLTNKKKNRMYLKTGFVPSRIIQDNIIYMTEEVFKLTHDELPEAEVVNRELTKKELKKIEKTADLQMRGQRANRRLDGRMSMSRDRTMDSIVTFLLGKDDGYTSGYENDSFYNQMIIDEQDELLTEFDKVWIASELQISNTDGRLRRDGKEKRQLAVLEALEKAGYNVLDGVAHKGINPNAIRALVRKYQDNRPMTLKEKKKEAKRLKKKRNKVSAILESDADQRMQKILLGNRIKMSKGEASDFRLSDLFGNTE